MTTLRARHVGGDDRAGGDERLLADLHARHEHGAAADPAGAPQRRAAQRHPLRVARHRVVVRRHRARAEEDVVLDDAVGRHVALRLDPHARADRDVVVDAGRAPDDGVRADRRALADERLVGDDRAGADARAGEDDRLRADDRAGLDDERARAARARRVDCLPSFGVLPSTAPSPIDDAVADDHAGVDDDVGAERHAAADLGVGAEDQSGGVAHRAVRVAIAATTRSAAWPSP